VRASGAVRTDRVVLIALVLAAGAVPGCYTPRLVKMQASLDSLRVVVDTLQVRNQTSYELVQAMRADVAEQKDILLSTRATTGSTTQELFDQMGRLNERLGEALGRFTQQSQRQSTPANPGTAGNPNQAYDQASQDLTQGRYAIAIQGFRDFLRASPTSDLADNARYGAGEGFFALSQFDSAATEYGAVVRDHPNGDRTPAALYKLALSEDKLGRSGDSKKHLEDLVKRFPDSGEAQLARERLGSTKRR
jgi:tol-pal system protein YbgF